jgi:DNA-binding response OmpR family regulator
VDKALLLGADDYLLKPSDPRELVELVKSLHDRWLSQPTAGHHRAPPGHVHR